MRHLTLINTNHKSITNRIRCARDNICALRADGIMCIIINKMK